MKKLILLVGATALLFVGCASHQDYHHARHYPDRYGDRTVIVESGDRVYVRESENHYHYGRDNDWSHRAYRGKHSDALGWNDPSWNR